MTDRSGDRPGHLHHWDLPIRRPRRVGPALREELNLAFDLDRDVEWQLGETDGALECAPRPGRRLEYQSEKPVDDASVAIEPGRGVDHPKDPGPRAHAVEVADRAIEASED